MSESYDLETPQRFTAGAVGEPGHRVFFLQAVGEGQLVTLKCEKQQVGALAEYLARILTDLPAPPDDEREVADTAFDDPAGADWVVGSLGVGWDEQADKVVLVCEQLLTEDEVDAGTTPASARFRLSRAQVAAFIEHARELVAAGRPPCYLCGLPMDPEGHDCPRLN